MSDKQRDYWSECGQVFFLDGWAWGLTEKCKRIRLVSEAEILQFFKDGIISPDTDTILREALNFIKEYRSGNGFTGDIRGRSARVAEHREASVRQAKTRNEPTIR